MTPSAIALEATRILRADGHDAGCTDDTVSLFAHGRQWVRKVRPGEDPEFVARVLLIAMQTPVPPPPVVPVNPDTRTLPGIGYWRGGYGNPTSYPMPHDYVRLDVSDAERAALAARLDAGKVVASFRGMSTCRICDRMNGSRALSDGKHVWPSGLSHYVREHGVYFEWPEVSP